MHRSRPARPETASRAVAALATTLVLAARVASACDVCAIYGTTELGETRPGLRLSVAEQWTRFATLKEDGDTVPNPGERLQSSITQVVAGYAFHPRVALQLNVPIISRTFRRLEAGRLTSGHERGIGDLALVGSWRAWSLVTEETVFHVSLLGGLEFPTGDTTPLGQELAEPEAQVAPLARAAAGARFRPRHTAGGGDGGGEGSAATPESGVHGHDLALGSGSYDGIVGGSLLWTWRRFLVTASGQYAIRGEGDFDYRYANDLTWTAAPGVYAFLSHTQSLAVQAVFSGETKGKDTQAGVRLDDTGLTALYLGPSLAFSRGTRLFAEVAADLPVLQHTTSLQIVPDYRVRGGVTWRF